jgi:hypothetical protein
MQVNQGSYPVPTLGPITVDLPPGYQAIANPQQRGVFYLDEQGRQIGAQIGDDDHTRRLVWIQYNRRQDRPATQSQSDETPTETKAQSDELPTKRRRKAAR